MMWWLVVGLFLVAAAIAWLNKKLSEPKTYFKTPEERWPTSGPITIIEALRDPPISGNKLRCVSNSSQNETQA